MLDIDIGELAPGHPLVVRRLLLQGDRMTLEYAWVPGITAQEWEARSVYLTIDYETDGVPSKAGDLEGSYSEPEGGPGTEGELIFRRPGPDARHVWFDFFAVNEEDRPDHRVSRLTIELDTGQARLHRDE